MARPDVLYRLLKPLTVVTVVKAQNGDVDARRTRVYFAPQLRQQTAMILRHGRHSPQSDLGLRHF